MTLTLILTLSLAFVLLIPGAVSSLAQEATATPLEDLRHLQGQARKLGARGSLPMAWRGLDRRIDGLQENGGTEGEWAQARTEAILLLNQADFMRAIRERKNSHEELLARFDQALLEIATLFDVTLDPVRSGSPQAEYLLESLAKVRLQRQVALDSLTLENRHLRATVGDRVVAQDSMITALNVEVSSLRQKLWETQLRAGVAEADRSAAETVLTAKQKREEAMAALFSVLGEEEGEILIKGSQHVTMRLTGVTFRSGSTRLGDKQTVLLARVAEAVKRFPDAKLKVEGHTDNTGTRQANLRVSRRRAEAVARALEKMLGRQQGSIETVGLGPDHPVALNDTPAGRARNRRIDLCLTIPE
ncbi:hypothetical protein CSA17_03975 [bacterium DOLJORAL78_65_58]|nr:MAG: hypothetical protein CSB20_13685 [bacterium DOLZORAL124_64_63]PIE76100.1 MAG: hypothetical protein CSA17_03975 [bacterium DOLJORAL78_65_58]